MLTTGTGVALTIAAMLPGGWASADTAPRTMQPVPGAVMTSQVVPAARSPVARLQGAPASPATPGGAAGELTLSPRDQPITAFLRDLFGRVGRPVVPSANLTGTVNGVFRGSVNKIFADIARAFNLVSYDDGAALYVYGANEVGVQTLTVGTATAQRVVRQVAAQRLADRRNYVRASTDGTLVASGTPRFLQQVSQIANGGGGVRNAGIPSGSPLVGGAAFAPPPVTPLEFRVFYLKYARAEDTVSTAGGRELRLPGLATILQNLVLDQRPGGSAATGGTTPTLGARLVRQSQPRLKGLGLGNILPSGTQVPSTGLPVPGLYPTDGGDVLGYGGFGGGAGGGGDVMAPLTQDVVRIEPNPYLNAVIVRDVPERMGAYDSLIRALDVEPQVVEVEATIIDINTDKLRRLGINWRLESGGLGFLFGDGTANDTLLTRNRGLSRRGNVTQITPPAAGGTLSTIIGSQREFLGRIQALETKGVARVVSRPQIMTLANVEAVFDRTRTFYVRVAGREEVDLFNVTAGTVLRVNPHVFRDQDQTRVRMIVNIEDGSISQNSLVENIPIVERASVSTQAMVLDGESLLLGGMTVDADSDDVYKIPLLGDIPLLGNLFKVQQRNRSRTERLFLITPRLVSLGSRVGPTTVTSTTRVAPTPVAPATPAGGRPLR
ncbi:type III secretion system outer membrane ring subunit SctC [Sphingomonas sp. Leaf412]|uniref:type III secretion system outer membrane ring subunit SctC n=1 Tax=Sphingomonas sp. Leaf412 TaxID=1736370 RepID=UPI00138EF909|nr:type III secretion system outer membrane ring subunit SctC [Sphingomonas sp. Leaf412]